MTQTLSFSANTGFLYKELAFLDRITQAAADGFDALEFHDEGQGVARPELKSRLADAGLPVMGLNVRMGDTAGLAAVPGSEADARADIETALELAEDIDAAAIHVLSGKIRGEQARDTLVKNLSYALEQTSRTILIEPLCQEKMPGYFLRSVDEALEVIKLVANDRLRVMFDCFHVEEEQGDTLSVFKQSVEHIGHIQIASWPERAEPQSGPGPEEGPGGKAVALDYSQLLPAFREGGYSSAFGCEYTPLVKGPNALRWRDEFS